MRLGLPLTPASEASGGVGGPGAHPRQGGQAKRRTCLAPYPTGPPHPPTPAGDVGGAGPPFRAPPRPCDPLSFVSLHQVMPIQETTAPEIHIFEDKYY